MGEVYKGRDTRLSREAAVKVLPAELAADAERLARFEHEARAASALNHPNIVTIYEVGTAGSVPFIAMELVEGKTLRELVASGPMPARKLLPLAAQIADGLAKAHEAGIVHRDLKPENVMVNRDGFVKLLDFGLAKLAAPTAQAESQLATLVADATRPGVVMGTVGYMSPEQASGERVDFRSDQFSLGSILYEMATGSRAFQRKTAIETLSAILREEPEPLAAASPHAPTPLRWIVERCLAKEPENRYAATRDLARDLKQTLEHLSETSVEAAAVERPKRRHAAWWAAGILALLAVGVADTLARRGSAAPQKPATLRQITFGPGLEDEPVFSPDGKFLAYTTDERGNLDVVVQPLGGGEPIRVASTDADEAQPAWSPDGSRLAFVSARDHGGRLATALNTSALQLYLNSSFGDIFVVPALGGAPAKLVEDGHYPSWSPDGRRIVFMSNRGGRVKLWTIASEGGTPKPLTTGAAERIDYQPAWSPDGKWIVYGSGVPATDEGAWRFNLEVIPAGGGEPTPLTTEFQWVTRPAWGADSKTIFFGGDQNGIVNIFRVPIEGGRRSGALSRVTLGHGQDTGAAVSRDGRRLAFAALKTDQNTWELPIDGRAPRQVTHGGAPDYPTLSPDGKTLLVQSNQTGDLAVWTVDLQGKYLSRLTPGQELEPSARWSPDGTRFGYLFQSKLRIQSLGSLSAQETGVSTTGALAWSPDGRTLALGTPSGSGEIRLYDVASGKLRSITNLKQWLDDPTWSPDGKQVAFMLQRGRIREIWVVPADGGPARALTKDMEDSHPYWSPRDPDTILFLRDHRRLATVSVSTGKVTLLPWTLDGSYFLDYPSFSPDGRKIYLTVSRKAGDIYLLEGF